MSTKNKKKKPLIDKKGLIVTGVASACVVALAFVMTMMLPKEEKQGFKTSAFETAVNEIEEIEENGLTSVYDEKVIAANSDATPQDEAPSAPNTPIFNKAIDGEIINDYSGDELVYSKTMNDWRTHNGIDYKADEGTDIMAVSDGTIEAITDNSMLGTTVIILHSGGLRSIYSNLSESVPVKIGDTVSVGTIIGKVGVTASAESAEEPHLHFEMSLNEETVNPHDYIK